MQMMVPYSKDNVVDYCKYTENFDPSFEHDVAAEKVSDDVQGVLH